MKFMVELKLIPGSTRQAVEAFEQRGPNRSPGVAMRGAWVGTGEDFIFALVESDDESLVLKASQAWADVGDCEIHPVIDIEQF